MLGYFFGVPQLVLVRNLARLEGSEDLQPPDVIAAEIAENLQAALEQFSEIHEELTVSTLD